VQSAQGYPQMTTSSLYSTAVMIAHDHLQDIHDQFLTDYPEAEWNVGSAPYLARAALVHVMDQFHEMKDEFIKVENELRRNKTSPARYEG
jgi:hypothetical protein